MTESRRLQLRDELTLSLVTLVAGAAAARWVTAGRPATRPVDDIARARALEDILEASGALAARTGGATAP
ncbi:MAG: hypothetical protein AAGC55_03255 [Myxococcota bacterium]